MKSWICSECETEFLQESASACPQCGGIQISGRVEIVQPAPSGEAEKVNNPLPAVREVLRGLCERTYDLSYGSAEWDQMLEKALEELSPYLKAA